MNFNADTFKRNLGITVPQDLKTIYINPVYFKSTPLGFRFNHVKFILEIQYLTDMNDSNNYNTEQLRFTFAVNTDGNELAIDLKSDTLNILQYERGDVDSIGIKLKDLVDAEKYHL